MTTGSCKINHVALSVDDLDAAVKWYTEVFGFHQIIQSVEVKRASDPDSAIFKIYDGELHQVRIAYLGTGNNVGFEIFEFIRPKYEGATSQSPTQFRKETYTQGGFFHIAVTTEDPEALATKVTAAGGNKVGETVTLPNGETALYTQDPWGNVIEIASADFEALIT